MQLQVHLTNYFQMLHFSMNGSLGLTKPANRVVGNGHWHRFGKPSLDRVTAQTEPADSPPKVARVRLKRWFETTRSQSAEKGWSIALLALVALLVDITPMGRESTAPLVFFLYRTILFGIAFLSMARLRSRPARDFPRTTYLALFALTNLLLVSFLLNPGSRFNGFYRWYQHVLFILAFVALARVAVLEPLAWKASILVAVVGVDILHLVAALAEDSRPTKGPFVNPNYFASYLLVGFAASMAGAVFHPRARWRLASLASATFLFYGIIETWSRGTSLVAALIVVLLFWKLRRSVLLMTAGLGIMAALLLVGSPDLVGKFVDLGETGPYNYMRP